MTETQQLEWHRVAALDELSEGRVKTVGAGHHSFALTHYDGTCAARHVFGMVGHSNLGLADALRRQEAAGNLTY